MTSIQLLEEMIHKIRTERERLHDIDEHGVDYHAPLVPGALDFSVMDISLLLKDLSDTIQDTVLVVLHLDTY